MVCDGYGGRLQKPQITAVQARSRKKQHNHAGDQEYQEEAASATVTTTETQCNDPQAARGHPDGQTAAPAGAGIATGGSAESSGRNSHNTIVLAARQSEDMIYRVPPSFPGPYWLILSEDRVARLVMKKKKKARKLIWKDKLVIQGAMIILPKRQPGDVLPRRNGDTAGNDEALTLRLTDCQVARIVQRVKTKARAIV